MVSPQIISSLFDLVREVFNSNNRKKKTKWLNKLIITFLLLTIGICFAAIGILTTEVYSTKLLLQTSKIEINRLKKIEYDIAVLRETNSILTDLVKKKLPDKDITIITNGLPTNEEK